MSYGPGTVIADKLRLVRHLARGGMGSVWVADHLGLQARVAVKFVSESFGDDKGVLTRFAREAAAAAKMRSPHVVQILDYGMIDGRIPYIVMELLEGESLGDRVQRLGRISVAEAASIVQQTCKALARAHSLGIIHRDIKPDNIFLTDADGDLFVKVLDFGIAKVDTPGAAELTSTGTTVGTPSYASPEQLLSAKSATVSMDLWAVAATAYRAVTGTLPFNHETFAGLCVAITSGVFTPPTQLQSDLPVALDAWFARALDVAPERRFASARELAEQFAVAAGISRTSISIPGGLAGSARAPFEDRSGSSSGLGQPTKTVGVPGFESPSQAGSSIGGAAFTDVPFTSRSSGKVFAIVAAVVVLVCGGIILLITRNTPEVTPAATGSSPPRATAEATTAGAAPVNPAPRRPAEGADEEPRVTPREAPVGAAPDTRAPAGAGREQQEPEAPRASPPPPGAPRAGGKKRTSPAVPPRNAPPAAPQGNDYGF